MRNSSFWWVLIVFMVLIDLYVFQALKFIAPQPGSRYRPVVLYGYWIISIGALLTLLTLPYLHMEHQAKLTRTTIFAVIAGIFFAKLVASLFFAIDDIRRLIQWIAGKFFFSNTEVADLPTGNGISRSAFLTWTGMLFGGGIFATLVHGFGNKYNYQVKRVPLSFSNLPPAFRGLRILQLSDIHSGSFTNKEAVIHGVEKAMALKPDLILFTGDLVNNTADEMDEYMDVFDKLKAPMGVYSSLGNHDYGDYASWNSPEEKKANLARLKDVHKQLGWRLLMNEHVAIEKEGQQIALIGIENWSAKGNFPKYGDMARAYQDTSAYPFKILLSHDPSHWDAQVRQNYKDVDLMLAGHTHGMQFGIEIPGFRWSPVQYMYRQWAGLYEKDNQKLYVNRGFGFIGYPGRVGILPEITLLELT